jgi:hypothetical protein
MGLVSFHDFIRSILMTDDLERALVGALDRHRTDYQWCLQALEFAGATSQCAEQRCARWKWLTSRPVALLEDLVIVSISVGAIPARSADKITESWPLACN